MKEQKSRKRTLYRNCRGEYYSPKNENAITLIVLVISIIILLILAGISISAVIGDNGILDKSTDAAEQAIIAYEAEAIETLIALEETDRIQNPDKISEYYLGTTLYDKILINGELWNIVVINDSQEIYGTGWALIEAGTDLIDYGEAIYSWLVNYETGEKIRLELGSYTRLDYTSTVAVTEGLALNIDATNMESGSWEGITKHGDVEYDSDSYALIFNEDEEENPDGEGGYLELTKDGLDFSDGFAFEIYANLSRLRYDNGNDNGNKHMGLFCRFPTITSSFTNAMKFGYACDETICRFYSSSSWSGTELMLNTAKRGCVEALDGCGYIIDEDFYLTFVYVAYDENKSTEYQLTYYDDYMIENGVDKILYYINGKIYGYTYYGSDSYKSGLEIWNTDENPFFIGVCPWNGNGNLYYLKGKVYTTRLYEIPLTEMEVLANYNTTLAYRSVITGE